MHPSIHPSIPYTVTGSIWRGIHPKQLWEALATTEYVWLCDSNGTKLWIVTDKLWDYETSFLLAPFWNAAAAHLAVVSLFFHMLSNQCTRLYVPYRNHSKNVCLLTITLLTSHSDKSPKRARIWIRRNAGWVRSFSARHYGYKVVKNDCAAGTFIKNRTQKFAAYFPLLFIYFFVSRTVHLVRISPNSGSASCFSHWCKVLRHTANVLDRLTVQVIRATYSFHRAERLIKCTRELSSFRMYGCMKMMEMQTEGNADVIEERLWRRLRSKLCVIGCCLILRSYYLMLDARERNYVL